MYIVAIVLMAALAMLEGKLKPRHSHPPLRASRKLAIVLIRTLQPLKLMMQEPAH